MQQKTLNLLHRHALAFTQHQCHASEQDYEAFDEKISSFLRVWELENSMYSICDFKRQCFFYLSPKLCSLLGDKSYANWTPGKLEGLYARVHPDDLDFVLDTETRAKNYLHPLPLYEKLQYKLVYDYRIKGAGDDYYRLAHRVIILEYDKYGNSWLGLVISDVLSTQATARISRRYLINNQTGNQCLFNEEISPEPIRLLTPREEEILLLVSQGLDSAAISKKLFISINTVNNHRQNILSKTNTNNLIQAYYYYRTMGS